MHDIIHDFVQFITKKDSLITEAEDANRKIEVLGSNLRHLNLTFEGVVLPITSGNCKSLRTLIAIHSGVARVDASFILEFKRLRTINLSGNFMDVLPKEIGELVHLRHFDLSRSKNLGKLPDAVCGLYNLYTLDLRGCRALEKLPDSMGKLISLKHLYIDGCRSLKYLPKGIGRLTSLQTLDVCPLFSVDNDEAFQAGDLGSLNQLQGSLRIRILGKVKDGSGAQLRDNKQLFHLQLDFLKLREKPGEISVQIMNVLRPHDDLESLEIRWYSGWTWPNWLVSLNQLRFLTLWDNICTGCKILPPLGRLPFLEKLYVQWMWGVRKVGGEFLGVEDDDQTFSSFKSSSSILFPKLKQLEFSGMSLWTDWEGVKGWNKVDSGITIMPCLSSLDINWCGGLETLPDFLCEIPLQNLTISRCWKLAQCCKIGSGKEWPKISHIPNIQIQDI